MIEQISDIFKLYGDNFKHQVEQAFNTKYNDIDDNCLMNEVDLGGEKELIRLKTTDWV